MIIREAELKDLSSMLVIESACFTSDKISKRQMRYIITKAKALNLVVELDQQVVAYACFLTPRNPKSARLYSLAVLPTQQAKGYAKQLLQKGLEQLQQSAYKHCRLEVRASQLSVQALYKMMGFSELTIKPSYYEDGEAAIQMQKIISS